MLPNVEVVGICDIVPERTRRFAEQWKLHWPNIRSYSDHKDMLSKEGVDILTVATPDPLHAQVTVDGAMARVKAILCEKPKNRTFNP